MLLIFSKLFKNSLTGVFISSILFVS